jgi:Bacterial trigger factor protein (TF)
MVLSFRISPSVNVNHPSLSSSPESTTTLWNAKVATSKVYASTAVAIVPLFPEPPGGIEIQPLIPNTSSIGVSRMKQLDTELPPSSSSSLTGSPIYQFWMTTYSDGKSIQEIRQTILKDASKKANFPGFRKGQVPPYAQPQITQFAIQESIIKKVEQMVLDFGLESISGSDGQVQVHEDVSEMTKLYKTGTSILFTATLSAKYDESKIRQQVSSLPAPETEDSVMVESFPTNVVDVETNSLAQVDNDESDSAENNEEKLSTPLETNETNNIVNESSNDSQDRQ